MVLNLNPNIGFNLTSILLVLVLILNFLFAIFVIFRERRDASSTWAWLLVLFFIPVLGFILYLLFGQNLSRYHLFQWDDRKKIGIEKMLWNQLHELRTEQFHFRNKATETSKDLIHMHLLNNDAVLTEDNSVEVFTDGQEKFARLFKDIAAAKNHIHLQYYIIKRDELGKKLIDALTVKAKDGVKVRVLYDDLGSRTITKSFLKELRQAGGEVEVFFPSKLRLINLRLNYRNHRKLVIIDGKIGYVGGFNVGDEYLGLNPKFGYWRDTHLRIEGTAVHAVQTRFILDWNQASHNRDIAYAPEYFPEEIGRGYVGMQIVTSGPDSEWQQIKNGYIKMISSARKSILIQTPYFIPDASLLDALQIACLSGIDVKIMIPNKPDHMFVYWATLSYIGELLKAGATVFIYEKGFIHAKMLVVDEQISSVGTANIDVRSFKLNFEVNAFLYDETISRKLSSIFQEDLLVSNELTLASYQSRSARVRFKESVSRLLSPIL
ncbi:cardiolipin synthase [Bacillus canaveralius]|uniref:Cardiolipin synthase n=1 Tax=Bacillus canaveralius TaxID=1403243 RepID=A0A2N5GIN8_9BACI|nr:MULTISPECIES: cardiolipin synthase [Bacillus]PLR80882.1 cardiolipin synthase [Bacillus canaveralius]PLR83392.1 cardiolipin synthase [Bacillus sp. V33-4]PLR91170.1 cardiolipin synthase [Bacillus canaveralius]RSK51752.1 cardiolipin synthase [Bacillus canaveralius]